MSLLLMVVEPPSPSRLSPESHGSTALSVKVGLGGQCGGRGSLLSPQARMSALLRKHVPK